MAQDESSGLFVECEGTNYDMKNPAEREAFISVLDRQPKEYRETFLARLHEELDAAARSVGCYAGLPLIDPESDTEVIGRSRNAIEDTFFSENLSFDKDEDHVTTDGYRLINGWTAPSKNGECQRVSVWEKDGKREHTIRELPSDTKERFSILLRTIAVRQSHHRVHAEKIAHEKLLSMLSETQQNTWLLSSCFLQQGRSGVYYLVRKGLPSIAFRMGDGQVKMLAALCFHPLAYYGDSFAGAMVPSDEAIAHLLFIKGDEHRFWKRAGHHALSEPRSGL